MIVFRVFVSVAMGLMGIAAVCIGESLVVPLRPHYGIPDFIADCGITIVCILGIAAIWEAPLMREER